MSKILAVGAVLPEFAGDRRLVAASYRMEQFVIPLIQDGHDVTVCGTNAYSPIDGVRVSQKKRLIHYHMDCDAAGYAERVQSIHDELKPDCIIGVQKVGSIAAARIRSSSPMWIDFFGSPTCEAQARSYVYDDDRCINELWGVDQPCLVRGDIFSTCGTRQEHFLTGRLSLLGRLNKNTFGYRFVYPIPPGIAKGGVAGAGREKLLRGRHVDEDDFAVLWCGGYNVWTDVDTLFSALEKAFSANDKIKFVSMGGRVERHDDLTYPRFERMIAESRYRDRFVLLGWRSHAQAIQAYSECDLGISIDRYHYEPVYGTRTRIVEMIRHKLPVITSLLCELSYILKDGGAALTFGAGDASDLAERIVSFSKLTKEERVAFADKAYRFFGNEFSYEVTTEPLRNWVRNPMRAPDRDVGSRPVMLLQSNLEYYLRLFENNPEGNISVKRLLGNKVKAKFRKIIRALHIA
jgi:glycosyltransferase involved in cell wall biosynthesis